MSLSTSTILQFCEIYRMQNHGNLYLVYSKRLDAPTPCTTPTLPHFHEALQWSLASQSSVLFWRECSLFQVKTESSSNISLFHTVAEVALTAWQYNTSQTPQSVKYCTLEILDCSSEELEWNLNSITLQEYLDFISHLHDLFYSVRRAVCIEKIKALLH